MPKKPDTSDGRLVVSTNRKARRDFEILETYEAGIALLGSEVKSIRQGQVELDGAYGDFRGDEMVVRGFYLKTYKFATMEAPDPKRTRKLLLKRREIEKLRGRMTDKSLRLVILSLYFKRGWAKVEIGLAKSKRKEDRRRDIKTRDLKREMDRSFRGRFKS